MPIRKDLNKETLPPVIIEKFWIEVTNAHGNLTTHLVQKEVAEYIERLENQIKQQNND